MSDEPTVVLRPRGTWEIADLAEASAVVWWKGVFRAWAITMLPVGLLAYASFRSQPAYAALIVWFAKPVYDGAVIQMVSRALFGRETTFRELAWGAYGGQVWPYLSFRRLSVARSLTMALRLLERPRGAVGRQRLAVIRSTSGGTAFGLLFGCAVLEFAVFLGLIFSVIAASERVGLDSLYWDVSLRDPSEWWYVYAAHFVAVSLVEPVYAVGGFSTYIAARNAVEGWDLEVGFRRIARRVARLGLITVCLCLPARFADAQQPAQWTSTTRAAEYQRADDALRTILAHEDFDRERVRREWQFKRRGRDATPQHRRGGAAVLATFMRWTGITVASALTIWFVGWTVSRVRLRGLGRRSPRQGRVVALVAQTGASDGSSLAFEPAARARGLWQQGQHRAALALLYEGIVDQLVAHGIVVQPHWTEGDVLRATQKLVAGERRVLVRDVVAMWTGIAYAHRLPSDAQMLDAFRRWDALAGAGP